jgi:endonuclease III related protein
VPVIAPPALMEVYDRLFARFGPRHWWPAETPFEVCVGAILTQNTAWTNVEKAIAALRQNDLLSLQNMRDATAEHLAGLIRPAGYFNVKSRRLKEFVDWLFLHYDGSLEQMFAGEWPALRGELLHVHGIGPETADSILLYAGGKPSFVVDAYTRRLFRRLGLLAESAGYDGTRDMFMRILPADVQHFNEFHALIVEQCKRFCRTRPVCDGCPLQEVCLTGRVRQ